MSTLKVETAQSCYFWYQRNYPPQIFSSKTANNKALHFPTKKKKTSNLWPDKWILQLYNALSLTALFVKLFLPKKCCKGKCIVKLHNLVVWPKVWSFLKNALLCCWLFWKNRSMVDNSFYIRNSRICMVSTFNVDIHAYFSVLKRPDFLIGNLDILFLHHTANSSLITSHCFVLKGVVLSTVLLKNLSKILFFSIFACHWDCSTILLQTFIFGQN